jgi:hypothetical protein
LITVVLIATVATFGGCGELDDAKPQESTVVLPSPVAATEAPAAEASATEVTATEVRATEAPVARTTSEVQPTSTLPPSAPIPASAITHSPADISVVNTMHDALLSNDSEIRFGTQADPLTVTLGPADGGFPDYPAYEGKHSVNIQMPLLKLVIAPIDMEFVGFKNRSAVYRQDSPDQGRMEPFDDLELCFESVAEDWPGMIICVYHLHTTPLLESHLENDDCGIQEKWDGGALKRAESTIWKTLPIGLTAILNRAVRF